MYLRFMFFMLTSVSCHFETFRVGLGRVVLFKLIYGIFSCYLFLADKKKSKFFLMRVMTDRGLKVEEAQRSIS